MNRTKLFDSICTPFFYKYALSLFPFLFLCIQTKAQHLWQVYDTKIVKWNYIDGDEFNTSNINKNRWLSSFPWSRAVLSQDIYFLDTNVSLHQGKLQFQLNKKENLFALNSWEIDTVLFKKEKIRLEDGNKYRFKYTGGLIWSKRTYQYGYFEIKFKAPTGQGIWPAFWMYGGKPNNEIDFFELKGERENQLHVDVHCPDGCSNYVEFLNYRKSWGHWIDLDRKLKDGFNVVSGEWTENYVKFYLNGELLAYANHSFNIPMNLTAGTGIAKDGKAFKPGANKNTPFPNNYDVDYIRVYQTNVPPNYEEIKSNLSNDYGNSSSDSLYESPTENFLAKKASKKLKNNADKTLKGEKCITISTTLIANNILSVRVLGVSEKDNIEIEIRNADDSPIKQFSVKKNSEQSIVFSGARDIKISAKINNQVINETLRLK
jgi:beta-glucanase (GH16 family)